MDKEKLTPTEYELLTKSVYESILKAEGVDNIEVLHNQHIVGRSGVKHQIDVFWRFRQATVEHTVLVECKNFSSTIELGHVRNFCSVVEDIGSARGLIVTRVGYQEAAVQFASHHRIGLKLLRRPIEADWQGRVRNIQVNFRVRMLSTTPDRPINVQPHWVLRDEAQAERLKTVRPLDGFQTQQIFNSKGDVAIGDIGGWLYKCLPVLDKEPGGPYRHTVDLSDSYFRLALADGTTELFQTSKLDVDYYVDGAEDKIIIWGDEVVRYILRDFLSSEVEYIVRK